MCSGPTALKAKGVLSLASKQAKVQLEFLLSLLFTSTLKCLPSSAMGSAAEPIGGACKRLTSE